MNPFSPQRPAPQTVQQASTQQIVDAIIQIKESLVAVRQRVYAMEARQRLSDEARRARYPIEFRSQYGEDLWIWDVLGGQTTGFFIEVGAFDGYHYSVTYALEAMGWSGLLIEALPERFELCQRRRSASRVVHAALGRRGSSGTIEFTSVQDQYGGMTSFVDANTAHAQEVALARLPTTKIRVPLTSLDELLKDHTGEIDVVVIDVEGAELDLLDGFDVDKYKPRLLIIEENSRGRDTRLKEYMQEMSYVFAGYQEVNQFWIRTDQVKMLERLKQF